MRSQLAVRQGSTSPQIILPPVDVHSLAAAEEAIELADAYGVADGYPLDDSQRFTLRAALGEARDGRWAAATVADFEPRQSGKNDTLAARELAGLVLFGERLIIHTAHEFPTANESFLRLVSVFENWDDLRKKVARIRYANGEQGIEFLSGQRLKYRARTGGSGRGFAKADLVVYDEAQHLQAEHVAASGPARLANPNTQSWYMGSGGLTTSRNAWRLRRRALSGEAGRFAYVEHTAEQVSLVGGQIVSVRPDVLDRDAWALSNPAYGRRISDESLMSLYDELGPDLFGRECLCLWDAEPGESGGPLRREVWAAVQDPTASPAGLMAIGVDATPDQSHASIVVASAQAVELIENLPFTAWLVPRIMEMRERSRDLLGASVAVDPSGPAGFVIPALKIANVPVVEVTGQKMGQACAEMFTAVSEGRLRVRPSVVLDAAVASSRSQARGDAWIWSRKDSNADISPLVAATLAHWVATHQPEQPSPQIF